MAEGEGKSTYFMLEIHYDNPTLQRGNYEHHFQTFSRHFLYTILYYTFSFHILSQLKDFILVRNSLSIYFEILIKIDILEGKKHQSLYRYFYITLFQSSRNL